MKLSKTERIILENINEKYRYIARDKSGILHLYEIMPTKKECYWISNDNGYTQSFESFSHLFQDIKWKDEEPYKFR